MGQYLAQLSLFTESTFAILNKLLHSLPELVNGYAFLGDRLLEINNSQSQ
ncbi:hypothetical protein [Nostoc sp. PA-18-2419]|nr:hypothetical protein [Nostoc sp. PA-18-2419]